MSRNNIHKTIKALLPLIIDENVHFIKNVEEPPQWNYQLHIARLEYVQTF